MGKKIIGVILIFLIVTGAVLFIVRAVPLPLSGSAVRFLFIISLLFPV